MLLSFSCSLWWQQDPGNDNVGGEDGGNGGGSGDGNGDGNGEGGSGEGPGEGSGEGENGEGEGGDGSGSGEGGTGGDGSGEGGDGSGSGSGSGEGGEGGSGENEGACSHGWELVSTTATCLEGGESTFTCSLCKEEITKSQDALGHSLSDTPIEEKIATCTEGGYSIYACQRDDCQHTEKLNETEPDLTNHDYKEIRLEPTCTAWGYVDMVCSWCGRSDGSYTVLDPRHTPVTVEGREPNCFETGLTDGEICSICNTTIVEQEIIPVKHTGKVVEGYLPPDCFTPGLKDGSVCSICGTTIIEQEIIPAGHTPELIPGKIATCTETGLTDGFKCSVCNDVIKAQEVIPYTLHNFVDGKCTHCECDTFSQGLSYSLSADGEYYIVDGIGTFNGLYLIIPETHNNKPVKAIATSAFASRNSFISLVIPKTIESIGSDAFSYCNRLVEVYNLSNHIDIRYDDNYGLYANIDVEHNALDEESILKQYGDFIFAELNSAPSLVAYTGNSPIVVLPEDYNGENYYIYDYAFYECRNMVSVTVPKAVKKVGLYAFNHNFSLAEVYYLAGMQLEFNGSWMQGELGCYADAIHYSLDEESVIDIVDDFAFLKGSDGEYYLVAYVGESKEIVLPESYNGNSYSIYPKAFQSTNLEKITVTSNVKRVGKGAFAMSKNLHEVIFEEGVYEIGENAFMESGIRKIELPNSVTTLGIRAFNNCVSLGYAVLGDGIEVINDYTFFGCANIVSVTLPKNLKSIGNGAFGNNETYYQCTRLQEIVNHSSLTLKAGGSDNGYIAYNAKYIYNDVNAKSNAVIYDDYAFLVINGVYYLAAYLGTDTEITLPTSANGNSYEIGYKAFFYRNLIKSITIPSGVTAIGEYSFRNCVNLTTVSISGTVKSIGNYAFSYCGKLTSVTIAEGLKSLGKYAFINCSALANITLPKSLQEMNADVFKNCTALTSVKFLDPKNWYGRRSETSTPFVMPGVEDAEGIATSLKTGSVYWFKQ